MTPSESAIATILPTDPAPGPVVAPAPAVPRRRRWRRWALFALVLLAIAAAAGWRYRITRPGYRLARGQAALRVQDWERAEEYASRLAATGHADHARLLRGESLLLRHNPDLALAQFGQIETEGPIRSAALPLVGRSLMELGRVKEAYRILSFAVHEEPENIDAHRALAVITYDLGQLSEAAAHLEEVARLDPKDARPHRLLGMIYRDLSQDERAVEAYREAIRRGLIDRVRGEVRFELAEVCITLARFADAIEVLETIPGDGPDPPWVAAIRIEALRGLGHAKEARELLEQTLTTHQAGALYRLKGQLDLDDGRPADAIPSLETAVERNPSHYQSRYLLGQAYYAVGRKEDAAKANARADELRRDTHLINDLTRVAMDKPWDPTVRLQLAEVCERMGSPELAAMWRSAANSVTGQRK